jgi:hypothetical protein
MYFPSNFCVQAPQPAFLLSQLLDQPPMPTMNLEKSAKDWAAWTWTEEDTSPVFQLPRSVEKICVDTASTAPSIGDWSDTASTASSLDFSFKRSSTMATELEELPFLAPDFEVSKTFVTVKPAAAKRRSSCPARVHTPATVMLRNLPNRAKQDRIEEHMHSIGFHDFGIHLPIDSRTGVNKGYAFIRLEDEAMAKAFMKAVERTRLPGTSSNSSKRLTAVYAANQGAPLRPRSMVRD